MRPIRLVDPVARDNGRSVFTLNDQMFIPKGSYISLDEANMVTELDYYYINSTNNVLNFTVNGIEIQANLINGKYSIPDLTNMISIAMNKALIYYSTIGLYPVAVVDAVTGTQFKASQDPVSRKTNISFNTNDPFVFSPRNDNPNCEFNAGTRQLTRTGGVGGFDAFSVDTVPFCQGPSFYCAKIIQLGGSVCVGMSTSPNPPTGDPEDCVCAVVADSTTGNYTLIVGDVETVIAPFALNDTFGIATVTLTGEPDLVNANFVLFRGGVGDLEPLASIPISGMWPIISLDGPLGFRCVIGNGINDADNRTHCVDPFLANLPDGDKIPIPVTLNFSKLTSWGIADLLGFVHEDVTVTSVNGTFTANLGLGTAPQNLSLRISCPELAGSIEAYDTMTGGQYPILAIVNTTGESNTQVKYMPWNPARAMVNRDIYISNLTIAVDDINGTPVAISTGACYTLVIHSPWKKK